MSTRRAIVGLVGLIALCLGASGLAVAQEPGAPPRLPDDLGPGEVQQLFDAFELVRAQEMLGLSDEQYPQFVARLKNLQDVRRNAQQQRMRLLRELQRLANQPGTDDASLEAQLDALTALDRQSADARVQARDAIDALLDVRQRVRFRMFEQAMERRRVDLLMRARRPRRQALPAR